MGAYLEILEKKHELGLITNRIFIANKKWYKNMSQKYKDIQDNNSDKKLILLKEDKMWFITIDLLLQIKDIKNSNNSIKGWLTFIGILYIIGIIGALITLID